MRGSKGSDTITVIISTFELRVFLIAKGRKEMSESYLVFECEENSSRGGGDKLVE